MDETLRPAPKPFTILTTHAGATTYTAITSMVIDGVSGNLGYYTVKQGFKGKIYEIDVAAKDESIVYIEECKNLTTTPLAWLRMKTIELSSMGHIGRTWRYPVIIEAYEYDIGIRVAFQQTSSAQIDVSMHGEASPLG